MSDGFNPIATFNAYTDYEVDVYSKAIRQNSALNQYYWFLRNKTKHCDGDNEAHFDSMKYLLEFCGDYLNPGE